MFVSQVQCKYVGFIWSLSGKEWRGIHCTDRGWTLRYVKTRKTNLVCHHKILTVFPFNIFWGCHCNKSAHPINAKFCQRSWASSNAWFKFKCNLKFQTEEGTPLIFSKMLSTKLPKITTRQVDVTIRQSFRQFINKEGYLMVSCTVKNPCEVQSCVFMTACGLCFS